MPQLAQDYRDATPGRWACQRFAERPGPSKPSDPEFGFADEPVWFGPEEGL